MLGEKVKRAIKLSGKPMGSIAESLNISREHLSRMLKTEVSDTYVERIKKLGVDFDNVILLDNENRNNHPDNDTINKALELMGETMRMLSDAMDTIKSDNSHIKKNE